MVVDNKLKQLVDDAENIVIIQAENPDGDSIGSALALEEILGDLGKSVSLYCPVEIPKYLRYISGWDRISNQFEFKADLAIIVDTTSSILLKRVLDDPAILSFLQHQPVVVIDHHATEADLAFQYETIIDKEAVASGQVVYVLATNFEWPINAAAATNLFISIKSDSLGLVTDNVSAKTFEICAQLVSLGANPAKIDEKRREFMKKTPEILTYKGRLIGRIEYFLEGRLALILVPFEEIVEYSDKYNPTMLVLDEMRLVTGVEVAIGVKTYPDGKLTGKLRCNLPVAETVAKFFGGGGHQYAAGFRIYENYDEFLPELIRAVDQTLEDYSETV
jgi:phosphoesterase RecJ-like protein